MKEDIIRQVKSAEDLAEKKIRETEVQADNILHDARHQAVEYRMERLEAARAEAKELFEAGVKDFETELEKVCQSFEEEMAQDAKKAQKAIESVIKFVAAQFKESLGRE